MAKLAEATKPGSEPRVIHLWGDPGTGKSCIAATMFLGWAYNGPECDAVRWFRASEVVDWIIQCRMSDTHSISLKDEDGHFEEITQQIVERRVKKAGLVIFDDIGTRKATEPACEVFLSLIEARAGRFTIFTGNNDPTLLAGLYSPRIASRIIGGLNIHVGGDDQRAEQAEFL